MVSIDDLNSWDPNKLSSIGDDLVNNRRNLTDLQDDVDDGRPPNSWVGADSVSAENSHKRLVERLVDQVGELRGVIEAVDAASGQVKSAKSKLAGALGSAQSHGFTVDHESGSVTSPKTYTDDDEKHDDEALMQQIADDIGDALKQANEADQDLTNALTSATKGTADALGSLSDQSLDSELHGMTQDEQVKYLRDHPDRAPYLLPNLPDSVKQALGQAVSDDIDSTLNGDSDIDQDEVDRLKKEMHAYLSDPTVASATYQKLGAAGTVASLEDIAAFMRYGGVNGMEDIAGQLRHGLATATNAPGFPAQQFGHDLVKYAGPSGDYLSESEEEALHDRYPNYGGGQGAAILTYLMSDHQMNGNTVLGAAEGLDTLERNADPRPPMWYNYTASSPLTGLVDPHDMEASTDPMATIMDNLGDHPEQGYQFFTEDDSRQNFYFNDRTWKHDGYEGIAHAADGIGTDPDLVRQHPQETSMLVSRFVDDVADNDGFNAHDAKPASPYVSNILKNYMMSVDDALQADSPDGDPGVYTSTPVALPDIPGAPRMFADDVQSLLKVGASTQDGLVHLAEGVGTFQQAQINNATHEVSLHPGDYRDGNVLSDVIQHSAYLNGAIEHAIGSVEIEHAAGKDAQIQAFTGLVGDVVGEIPLPGSGAAGKAIEFGVGHAIDLATDKANGHFANFEQQAIAHSNDRAAATLNESKITALEALSKSGAIHLSQAHAEQFFPGGKPVDLSTLSDDQLGDLATLASNRYLNDYGMGSVAFKNSYDSAFHTYY